MKKTAFLALALLALTANSLHTIPKIQTKAAESSMEAQVGKATYISQTDAPVIDGLKDYNWTSSGMLIGSLNCKVSGSVDIMWNETGIYYFVQVYDNTYTRSDMCNFWISETFYDSQQDMSYFTTDGTYYLCLNTQGENFQYQGFGLTDEYTARVLPTGNGYTMEVFIPVLGSKPLQANASIGFDISIDDYTQEGGERSSYENWNGRGSYWSNPSMLGQVILLPDESVKENSSSTGEVEEQTSSSGASCSAIAFAPVAVALGTAFVLLRKKKE